jgi:hypothetical protein
MHHSLLGLAPGTGSDYRPYHTLTAELVAQHGNQFPPYTISVAPGVAMFADPLSPGFMGHPNPPEGDAYCTNPACVERRFDMVV